MIRFLLAVLFLAVAATPAASQINTLEADDPRENASLRAGPLYVSPRVELTELGFDTNVFNTAGERETDFTFTLSPTADVWLPVARRGLIKASLATDLVWYREFASERSIDPSLTLRGEAYLRRFTLFLENAFLRSRQRPSFEIDLRSRRLENTFMAGVDMRITPKLSLEVHGSRSVRDYEADAFFLGSDLEERLNRNSTGVSAVTRFYPTVLTMLALRAERFEERFPLSPLRDADNVRVTGGVEFGERALITGRAYLGVRQLSPLDEAVMPAFTGLVSDVGLSYTILGATTIGLSHRRDLYYSFEPTQPYYVDTGIGATVRRALGSRFDVVVTGERHTYAYRDLRLTTIAPSNQDERVDTIWNYGGSVGYRIGRDGRLGLGVSYWTRESTTVASRAYDGLRVGTSVSYGF